jgi:hypothetical protein
MRRLAAMGVALMGMLGCTAARDQPVAMAATPAVASRTAAVPVIGGGAPTGLAPPACAGAGSPDGPLDGAALAAARGPLPADAARIAAALAVDCAEGAAGFEVALAQAIARFQRRFGRYADEVTGLVDARTRRQLEMIHPALRAADHPCAGEPAAAGPAIALPACLLRWPGASAEQLEFMQRVYDEAQARAAARRSFSMAADDVDVIEHGPCPGRPDGIEPGCRRTHLAAPDAARAGRRLLEAARGHFSADRKAHGQRDLIVYTGYRSAAFQLEIWEYRFPERYRATQAARARLPGGPHGRRAAQHLAAYYAARTAPPGFSLHGRGLAIDFGCVTKEGDWIGSNGSFVRAWKSSYCFRWLSANAGRFGFQLNPNIDEPWHWEYVGGGENAGGGELVGGAEDG